MALTSGNTCGAVTTAGYDGGTVARRCVAVYGGIAAPPSAAKGEAGHYAGDRAARPLRRAARPSPRTQPPRLRRAPAFSASRSHGHVVVQGETKPQGGSQHRAAAAAGTMFANRPTPMFGSPNLPQTAPQLAPAFVRQTRALPLDCRLDAAGQGPEIGLRIRRPHPSLEAA